MNGGKVIDIQDIQSAAHTYGTNDPSIVPQDLNQDGVVQKTVPYYFAKNSEV